MEDFEALIAGLELMPESELASGAVMTKKLRYWKKSSPPSESANVGISAASNG